MSDPKILAAIRSILATIEADAETLKWVQELGFQIGGGVQ